MRKVFLLPLLGILTCWAISSCKHEPIDIDDGNNNVDTLINGVDTLVVCDLDTLLYSDPILPILQSKCYSCHSGNSVMGNLDLSKYDQLTAVIENGSFWGSLIQEDTATYTPMPYLSPPLDSCSLVQINAWLTSGYQPDIPVDTTVIVNPPDTTIVENPCLPGVVYFERDVLPLLITYCADAQCHDNQNPEEGIRMTSYTNVINTGDIVPGNPEDSGIWEEMMDTDPDKHMPPYNQPQLTQEQLDLIENWILQGAQNLTCNEPTPCDTIDVSYSGQVALILQNKCIGCHSGSTPADNLNLTLFNSILTVGNNGKLVGAINGSVGYTSMPPNLPLSDCDKTIIESWVAAGMPNN